MSDNKLKGQEPPYDLLKKHADALIQEERMAELLLKSSRGRGKVDEYLAEAEIQRLTNRIN